MLRIFIYIVVLIVVGVVIYSVNQKKEEPKKLENIELIEGVIIE